MPRNPTHYTGATKHVTLAEARRLDPRRYAIQEKIDGMFCRLYLDSRGRVARAFARSGAEILRSCLDGIVGQELGRPHSELVGELEAHTEAGNAAAKARGGQRLVHLFDCLHDGTRSLVREPYRVRRDALFRTQSMLEARGPWKRPRGRAKWAGWRVAPIVPQAPLSALESEWERVKGGDLEGLVLVALDAPAGAKASKLKLKPYETIDCEAVHVSRTTVVCSWNGHLFSVGRGRHHVETGELVEVRHAGWYGGVVLPRFPALVRVRRDLQ